MLITFLIFSGRAQPFSYNLSGFFIVTEIQRCETNCEPASEPCVEGRAQDVTRHSGLLHLEGVWATCPGEPAGGGGLEFSGAFPQDLRAAAGEETGPPRPLQAGGPGRRASPRCRVSACWAGRLGDLESEPLPPGAASTRRISGQGRAQSRPLLLWAVCFVR